MPRRREVPKREAPPDPVFNSTLITKFLRTIMLSGKRSTAEGILYGSLDIIKERTGDDPLKVFKKAIDNTKPSLEVKSRRVGGQTYQIPVEVRPDERTARSIRWLIRFARERSERTMAERLANEFIAASKGEGSAVRQKEDVHRMAEANKAFAHYRF